MLAVLMAVGSVVMMAACSAEMTVESLAVSMVGLLVDWKVMMLVVNLVQN